MFKRISDHVSERDAITEELKKIMGHCDESPIEIDITSEWEVNGDELHIQVDDEPLSDDYYGYTISSMGAKGEELFMGEKDGFTYVMAYPENWRDTTIYVLNNKLKVNGEEA